MTDAVAEIELQIRQWWLWFGVALFLLIPLDLITTFIAVANYGIAVEVNPIMRWLLFQGILAVTVVNLIVVGVAVYMFHHAIERIGCFSPSDRRILAFGVNVWLFVLIVGGVLLIVNNLLVIV